MAHISMLRLLQVLGRLGISGLKTTHLSLPSWGDPVGRRPMTRYGWNAYKAYDAYVYLKGKYLDKE